MAVRVILVAVLLAKVGALVGAVCVALVTVVVADDVTLPLQFAAVTVTVMVVPMSVCTKL